MKNSCLLKNILLPVLGLLACACTENEPVVPAPETVVRTVLVYMAANNNLGEDGYDALDISEMKKAASAGEIPSDCRWLIYHAPKNKAPHLMRLTEEGLDTIKTYDRNVLSVDSRRMSEVFSDASTYAPAAQWGLIFWSHASGWLQTGMSRSAASPDDTPQNYAYGIDTENGTNYSMNTSTMAEVIADAPFRPDFIYFDCCYMASVEAAYDLRNVTDYIVGSATELPAKGTAYDRNIENFMKMPEADIFGSASTTFNYYNAMSGASQTCTMSVIDTSGLDDLATATREIYENFNGKMPADYFPQRFQDKSETSCIYFDFKDYIHAICADETLLERFDEAFDRCVPYCEATPFLWNHISLSRHNGLSTYILRDPSSADKEDYKTLAWYRDVASAIQF